MIRCETFRELAPELAVGALPGDLRAEALVHLEHCGDCGRLVEELSDAADALLILTPAVDLSADFDDRVLKAMRLRRPRRTRLAALVAAAAVLLAGIGGADVYVHHTRVTSPLALGATGVREASFRSAPDERVVGKVFYAGGRPAWLFMTVRDDGSNDRYVCEVELAGGRRVRLGSFQLRDGAGSWGKMLASGLANVTVVRLLKASGALAAVSRVG